VDKKGYESFIFLSTIEIAKNFLKKLVFIGN